MPLVTLTVQRPQSRAFKDAVLDGVHRALVEIGVPPMDRFHRVLELDAEDFRYDARFPDLQSERSADFVLIEVLLSVGRSAVVKRRFLAALLRQLRAAPGLDPEQVMVVFKETAWENWSFGGGRLMHADAA
jgi:phenylpyruvate tautomerase PptA (4-oxalocrotonate tautomerase family)